MTLFCDLIKADATLTAYQAKNNAEQAVLAAVRTERAALAALDRAEDTDDNWTECYCIWKDAQRAQQAAANAYMVALAAMPTEPLAQRFADRDKDRAALVAAAVAERAATREPLAYRILPPGALSDRIAEPGQY